MKISRLLIFTALTTGFAAAVIAAPLDDRLAAFKKDSSAVTAKTVQSLLQLGIKQKRSPEVYAAVKTWLQANAVTNQETLYLAAVSAETAGVYNDAVSFYRKLLIAERVNPVFAAKAAPALYRLMIVGMRDPGRAYLFMRKYGGRLRAYGNANQFDPWFLDQAFIRNDLAAAAERLALIYNDSKPNTAAEDPYLKRFRDEFESYKHDDPQLLEAVGKLASARKIKPDVKARLLWVKEVLPVNAKVNELFRARKEVPASIYADAARAAENLIRVQPYEGSRLVALGWCHFGDSHTPNVLEKSALHQEIKSPQIFKAMKEFSTRQIRSLLATRTARGVSVTLIFQPSQMRQMVMANPEIFNSLGAPDVVLYYKGMKPEEAKKLAPKLNRNPHVDAALVRAVAAGNTTFTTVARYIIEKEMWRFYGDILTRQTLTRRLWDSGLKRDGDFRKVNSQLNRKSARTQLIERQIGMKASSADIRAAQKTLIEDLLKKEPSIPGSIGLFDLAVNVGSNSEKIALFKSLSAARMGGDLEYLLRRAALKVSMGNRNHYARVLPFPHNDVNNNFLRYGRRDVLKAGKVLGPHFQGILQEQMRAGAINETILGMWMRCVDPRDKKAIAFMKTLTKSPAWKNVNPAYLRLAKSGSYFGDALGLARDVDKSKSFSRELLALPDKPGVSQVKAALSSALKRLKAASNFPGLYGLDKAAKQPAACAAFIEDILVNYAPLSYDYRARRYQSLAQRYVDYLLKEKDYKAVQQLAQALWAISSAYGDSRLAANLVRLAENALKAGDASTVAAVAGAGMRFNSAKSRHDQERNARTRLKALYAKAGEAMGVVDIPVTEGQPGYNIFLSQREYVQDNLDTAWALYEKHETEVKLVLQKLRQDYCFWLLQRNVEKGEVERVEELVKGLTVWDRRGGANFSLEQQAVLKLAYADVAFQKRAYGTARSWYRKVADSREYKGSQQQYRAILGSVAVDREEKNYDNALAELERLMLVKDDQLREKVHFARAQIFFAQEKYAEADLEIASVLRQDPQHADAKLLQGKLQIAKRDLVSPTKIRIGMRRSTKAIEPGERIEIDLKDPSLSVSGSGVAIEVEVRASSGDVERTILRPVGDSNTEYRAEVRTALGASRKGDKVLQVAGRDTISYGFSKRFRQKMKDLPPDPKETIGIASDFSLSISAGDFPAREGERRLSIEELGLSTADQALGLGRVRPGNPVYIRVIDPDQSRSAAKDTVLVEIKSSSGDVIRKFKLVETAPFSGEFEGAVPTASGQAVAYAYSSEPGRDPNMAISPKTDYPAWEGQVGSKNQDRFFTIDLNDAVALKKMTLASPSAKEIRKFAIQTSIDGQKWENTGGFPADTILSWDGRPQYQLVAIQNKNFKIQKVEPSELLQTWAKALEQSRFDSKIRSAHGVVKNLKGTKFLKLTGRYHHDVLLRYRCAFYQPEIAQRRFQLTGPPPKKGKFTAVFLIDGQLSKGDDPLIIDRELKPGLHEIEVWSYNIAPNHAQTTILCDTGGDELSPCPDAMFDPKTFPKAIRDSLPGPTAIRKSGEGTYDISFGRNIRTQLIRILIGSHAGESPAISRITLTDTAGRRRLPVKEDYQSLRTNQQLEVLPGDTIFVKYVDDLAFTEKRTQQERRLTVAFNNGSIMASFINYRQNRDGSRSYQFEGIRRFRMDDNVGFIITDADMDVSGKRDVIPFKVKTSDGHSRTYKAYETEAHSGVFLGKVFPITGKPQRESEIQMSEGGTLTAIYRDMENQNPGIPTDRRVTVEHAKYATPRFGVYTAVTEPGELKKVFKAKETDKKQQNRSVTEFIVPRIALSHHFLSQEELKTKTAETVYNSSVRFDVVAPHLALAESSIIHAYVQTETGRKAYAAMRKKAVADGKPLPALIQPFDVNVPGTLRLTGHVSNGVGGAVPAGYSGAGRSRRRSRKSTIGSRKSPLDEGRFSFAVNLALGDVQTRSFATKAAEELPADVIPNVLNVRPGESVYIGYAYLDKAGKPQWCTATVALKGDVLLDVLDGDYHHHLATRFVGEKVYVRAVAPALDRTPGRDSVTVQVKTSSGASIPFTIRETFGHTGIFKGAFKLGYASKPGATLTPQEFFLRGLPVRYGDTVTVSLNNAVPASFRFRINNGADGVIEPFTKRYTDNSVAIKTNFTLAECWFELAKMHRTMGKKDAERGEKLNSLSRREMKHAKKLLEEALATHRDPEQQAHAEYLLGNLSQEYADVAKNDEAKKKGYMDALARFTRIPVDYPKAAFASKAQYKKALVYEKMKQYDIAVDEYVKLAYKYPDDELIPMAMSRIGGFFQGQGLAQKKKADAKLKEDSESAKATGLTLRQKANDNFARAGKIFASLHDRYPRHPLAGLAGLRAGQNMMRIEDYKNALVYLKKVYENEEFDGPGIRAQAMYWAGLSNEKIAAQSHWQKAGVAKRDAFGLYNRIRFEFSASKWAKYARGRLASQEFAKLVAEDKKRRAMAMDAMKER